MARKSYQRGSVAERRYEYGTAYILRWRQRDPEGGWMEKTKTLRDCLDKKTAQRELDRLLREINRRNGAASFRANMRFCDVLAKPWPYYLDSVDVKPSTRASWDSTIKTWIEPFFGKMLLIDIGPTEVGNFMALLSGKGLSPKYRRNIYNLLNLMFEVAVEYDWMEASPVRSKLHRPKVHRKKKPSLSVEQVRALIKAIELPWRTPAIVLAMTGMRAGELLGLRWKNVDFMRRRISITHSLWRGKLYSPKTESSQDEIGMSEELRRILAHDKAYSRFTEPEDFVFCQDDGSPLDPDSLPRCGIYPALEKAGIPYVKRASGCHAFRHLVGSIIHRETGSLKLAQTQLRHCTVSTTGDIYTDIYTHVENEEVDEVASILGKSFREDVVEMWYGEAPNSEKVH